MVNSERTTHARTSAQNLFSELRSKVAKIVLGAKTGNRLAASRLYGLLVVAACIGLAIRLSIAWRDLTLLTNGPLLDDSFYSLNIARNISLGRGITHDGAHATNGFQPLLVFLMVPIYALFNNDQVMPVHLELSFLALLGVATAILLFKIVRLFASDEAGLFAAAVWLLSPQVINNELNGLETGLSVFMLAVSLWFYLAKVKCPGEIGIERYLFLGVLAGGGILARVDMALFVGIMVLDIVLWNIRLQGKLTKQVILKLAALSLSCIAIAAPWFIYSYLFFGTILPESGQAVRLLSLASGYSPLMGGEFIKFDLEKGIPIQFYFFVIRNSLFALIFDNPLLVAVTGLDLFREGKFVRYLVMTIILLIIIVLLVMQKAEIMRLYHSRKQSRLNFALMFCVLLVLAYTFYVPGFWFLSRYYFPIAFVSLIYAGLVYHAFVHNLRKGRGEQDPSKERWIKKTLLFAILLLLFACGWKDLYSHDSSGWYKVAQWINQSTEQNAKIGSFQSGQIGYFADRLVINLDGRVNSKAYQAMKAKRMLDYINQEGIEWLIDWPYIIQNELVERSPQPFDWDNVTLVAHYGEFDVYRVRSSYGE